MAKRKKPKFGDLVRVFWHDIEGEPNWKSTMDVTDLIDRDFYERRTYGIFIRKTETSLVVGASVSNDPDNVLSDLSKIPIGAVIDIEIILPDEWEMPPAKE